MVSTPCIKVCRIEGEHCLGCARHIDDIRNWLSYTEEERLEKMTGHRFKTKYGTFPTLEMAAARLGISIERAESVVMRGEAAIQVVPVKL